MPQQTKSTLHGGEFDVFYSENPKEGDLLMLAYKDKPSEDLTLQETYEFEKEMPRALPPGARGQMSN